MKKLMIIFMVLLAVCMTANAQTFSENFTGLTTGANLAGQSSWTKGGSGPDVIVASSTPLTYPGYNSGGGEYAVIPTGTATSSRVYKTFTSPITSLAHSTFYYSVLLRLTGVSASSNGYFMSLGNSGTGTQYGAKLFARTSGTGFNIGVSKTSNTAAFGASALNLNTTYLVVVRYSFNNTGFAHADSIDDEAYLWVNPTFAAEPSISIAECAIASGTGGTDFDGFSPNPVPYDIGNFIWHSRNATNPVGSFDGVRVGYGATSASAWTDLNAGVVAYNDPPSVNVTNAKSTMSVDGKLDEAEWANAQTLLFGPGAYRKAQAGEQTVTGGVNVKDFYDVNGKKFTVPYKDTSMAKVKFLRKGMTLYIGIQSDDKSLCKFDWEGDGLYMQIQNANGAAREVKLYYQNLNDTVKFEPGSQIYGQYAAVLGAGGKVNDSTNVATGYTMELALRLDSLGYTPLSSNIPVAMTIFDPDGFTHPMNSWDTLHGAFYKTWWGSEWGSSFRSLNLTPDATVYSDPPSINVVNAASAMTVDGKLDEAEWATAPTLLFGPGAYRKAMAGEQTVTGGVNVKENFDVNGKKFTVPYKDTSTAKVKFLRKGMNLYIGIQSDDKSICKFDWEGDGLYMQIQNAKGAAREVKLYYQNLNDTVRFEPGSQIYGQYAAVLGTGGKVNDSTNVATGYTMELALRLDSLGYTPLSSSIPVAMVMFDPDGFTHPMNSWDTLHGAFYKSWWGSEWGSSFRSLNLTPDAIVYNDPPSVNVTNAKSTMTVDGKLDEAEWATAPTLLFGPGAYRKALAGGQTVTGGVNVKENFDVNGKKFTVPYKDTSTARVKFLRQGMNLYIGIQSDDKSICKFDWEGDGLYMQIQNAKGAAREVKLYYQNLNDTVKFEPGSQIYGKYAAVLGAGGKVNDSTNVATGYTMELALRLDSLGYTPLSASVPVSMVIFDPDGFTHPMNSWDTLHGAYYKTWWGSEWGSSFRSLNLTPDAIVYNDPPSVNVTNAKSTMTVDGKLDEAEWATAPTMLFGPGAYRKAKAGEQTVTGGVNVKENFDVNGKKFTVPYKDTSTAKVKFLRKGMNLYIGIQSDDKSICKFDWEGDGLYMQIQNAKGAAREVKLYYQNLNDTVKFEPGSQIYGQYAAVLGTGGKVNDSTNVANGYTMELALRLDSLGYTPLSSAVPVAMVIFDPDGFTHPMNSWDTLHGAYYKTWWGSEWGSSFRSLNLTPDATVYADPDTMVAANVIGTMTVDGKLDEPEWANAQSLLFGPGAYRKVKTGDKTVTGGVNVKENFDVNGKKFTVPYKDTSSARVKFLRKGMNLYIGIQSDDKSICKFDWEGDGLYMQIQNAKGAAREVKLYYQNLNDTVKFEPGSQIYGQYAAVLGTGGKVNDSTNVANGYTMELAIRLDSLGYTATSTAVPVAMTIFDPDGFTHPMNSWDTLHGAYYKTWWGSEWGSSFRTIKLAPTTGVVEGKVDGVPTVFSLAQNYPNPFNPTTMIRFGVPEASYVTLKVYDIVGREIATLTQGNYTPGFYNVPFVAQNLASGVYFYQISSKPLNGGKQTFVNTKKLLLLK